MSNQSQNKHLWALTGLALLINIPYWSNGVWPNHDTYSVFLIFYTFYNNFFLNGELTRWLPFGSYGIQADFWQLISLTPFSYVVMVFGKIFGIKNILLMFKGSIFLEQLFFSFSMYFLGRRIYKQSWSALFISIAALLSSVWIFHIYFNLRIYYLLPFIFYLLLVFFKEKKPKYFWAGMIASVTYMTGNLHYFSVLLAMVLFLFVLAMFFKYPSTIKKLLVSSKENIIGFCLASIMAGCWLYSSLHMFDHMQLFIWGRNAANFSANASALAPNDNFQSAFAPLFSPHFIRNPALGYAGMLIIFFAVFALISARNFYVYLFAAIGFVVVCFSLGNNLFFYKLLSFACPPVTLFRYLNHLGPVIRLFVIVIAGFGFDGWISKAKTDCTIEKAKIKLTWIPSILIFFAMNLFLVYSFRFHLIQEKFWYQNYGISIGLIGVFLIIAIALERVVRRQRFLPLLAIAFLIVDLLIFQGVLWKKWPDRDRKVPSFVYEVASFQFSSERHQEFFDGPTERARVAARLIDALLVNVYHEDYSFIHLDPCIPLDPTIFEPKGLSEYFTVIYQPTKPIPIGSFLLKEDWFRTHPKTLGFLGSLGCQSSKLKIPEGVILAANSMEVTDLLKSNIPLDQVVMIETDGVDRPGTKRIFTYQEPKQPTVEFFSFNHLKVSASVQNPEGAWLYYADAFHPGWKAKINGERSVIRRANLAFKAIKLNQGENRVELSFSDGWRGIALHVLAILGFLFGLIMTGMMVRFHE